MPGTLQVRLLCEKLSMLVMFAGYHAVTGGIELVDLTANSLGLA
jgi:hypothetical protein